MKDTVGIAELGNGLVRIYIQRNVGDRRQIPAVKSVIDKIYTEFRSKGWIASQPQGKLPDIGQQVKPNPEQSSEFYGITIGIPVTQEAKAMKQGVAEGDEEHDGLDESLANGADDTFEADIDFMTKVISSGLNKQKSTGQTTIPVIPGQKSRMGADGMNEGADSVLDWKKLAGIK